MATNLPSNKPEDFTPYSGRIREDTLVKNRYYVIEKLGDGCYAKVFLVQDIKTDEVYALKAINKIHFKSNSKLRYMLDKEAKIHKSLEHPNIVKLVNYFDDENYVFFLLEYVFPGELFEILYERKGFSEAEAAEYIYQTTLALKHCWDNNILHRDLKPENLLLNEEGQIKLADFGWATYNSGQSVVGSVHYNSPEMLKYQKYDCKADIWAIGVLIYELLCCQQPFRGSGRGKKDKERDTERLIKRGRIYENKYTKKISKSGWRLITKILNTDPKHRPSYEEILADPWFKENLPAERFKSHDDFSASQPSLVLKRKLTLKKEIDESNDEDIDKKDDSNNDSNDEDIDEEDEKEIDEDNDVSGKEESNNSNGPKITFKKPLRFNKPNITLSKQIRMKN